MPDPAAPVEFYSGVLPAEMQAIEHRRAGTGVIYPKEPVPKQPSPNLDPAVLQKAKECAKSHCLRPLGVALSGGGIRSATFNLGVLQGLAERDLLPYVDYLSTVSGGGYIGSWFHGLVKRLGGQPSKAQRFLSPVDHPVPGTPDQDPVSFLRKFSNYLAPDPGLFSVDTWVIGSIWLRNVLLNQLVLFPAIAVLVIVALLAGFLQQLLPLFDWWQFPAPVVPAGLVLLSTVFYVWKPLQSVVNRSFLPPPAGLPRPGSAPATPYLVFISGWILTCLGISPTLGNGLWASGICFSLFAVFQLLGGFWRCFWAQHPPPPPPLGLWELFRGLPKVSRSLPMLLWKRSKALGKWSKHQCGWLALVASSFIWMPLLSAATTAALIWAIWNLTLNVSPWIVLAFAPPLACLAIMAGVSLLVGLMGADYPDGAREWLASVGSNLAMISAVWSIFFGIAVFGPWAVSKLLVQYSGAASAALTTWALTTLGGVLAGRSSSTNGSTQQGNLFSRFLLQIAPTLFVVGYLLLISFGVHSLIRYLPSWSAAQAPAKTSQDATIEIKVSRSANASDVKVSASGTHPNWFEIHLKDLSEWDTYFQNITEKKMRWDEISGKLSPSAILKPSRPVILLILLFLTFAIGSIASVRININEFSIHHFYKNRLVRCYMGASHGGPRPLDARAPDARTGFDPKDDFPIAELCSDPKNQYYGPYAIVNTALNLNAGSELATQERKACSFFFTPRFSGYDPVISKEDRLKQTSGGSSDFNLDGFRPTIGYSMPAGPALGTAMAISGAAANPNWGYHTSGPMAFLLTVFNVRLGWWLGNSRFTKSSPRSGPRVALKYLFMELLGQTTSRTEYVNLSDGGHFENLGLYELVRRRCRYIIVCDAEEDHDFTFEALGGAVRKCRADFGVEITINPDPIRVGENKFSSAHCVVGSILYPEPEQGDPAGLAGSSSPVPSQAQGWLLYVKASLTGNEPADIAQYHSAHTLFPHESTLNQFYTESQFESYRRLGLHAVRETFEGVNTNLGANKTLLDMFQDLTRRWFAPVAVSLEASTALNNRYSDLMRTLSADADLTTDFGELLAGVQPSAAMRPLSQKSFAFGSEVVQFMEDVVNAFDFEQSANFTNPGVSGWTVVFQRWVKCNALYSQVWQRARSDYQLGFQEFIENVRTPPPAPPPSV